MAILLRDSSLLSLPPRWKRALASAASLALMAMWGCGASEPPNVLLIVADTARADALSCYGGNAHTPNLCRLAGEGVLFENAYSNSNWTLPASVALFSGEFPTVYARMDEQVASKHDFYWVSSEVRTLAEALSPLGYETVGFFENGLAGKANTLQGFSDRSVDDAAIYARRAGILARVDIDLADARYRRILRILDFLLNDAPDRFFAVQWILDPHAAYDPPEHLPPRSPLASAELPRPPADYRKLGSKGDPKAGIAPLAEIADSLTASERSYLRSLYDRELESVDERIGSILEALDASGRTENTIVVFTSDHGEGFGEHGRFLHGGGRWLYDEFVRIPLILRGPGIVRGRRIAGPVSLVDLMPTLCEMLELACLQDSQGLSLRDVLTGDADALPDTRLAYIEGTTRRDRFDALVIGNLKLISTADGHELYDLAADPGERRNLAAERPETVVRLDARIRKLRERTAARRAGAAPDTDGVRLERASHETLEQLRALGYVESPD